MSYKMSKKLTRKELKERKRKTWKTIKDDNKDLKMSEAKDDYDKAMADLHKAHDNLVAELDTLKSDILVYKAHLKECREQCHEKDGEIARLNRELQGARLVPGNIERQVADPSVVNTERSGFSDDEEKVGDKNNDGAESKEDTSDGTSDGTSSGTSDDEGEDDMPVEEVDLLKKLRF